MATGTIKNSLSDTGWIDVGANVKYRKVGNIVCVLVHGSYSVSDNSWNNLGTIPSGFRPIAEIQNAIISTVTYRCTIDVNTNGEVLVLGNIAVTGNIFFFADN